MRSKKSCRRSALYTDDAKLSLRGDISVVLLEQPGTPRLALTKADAQLAGHVHVRTANYRGAVRVHTPFGSFDTSMNTAACQGRKGQVATRHRSDARWTPARAYARLSAGGEPPAVYSRAVHELTGVADPALVVAMVATLDTPPHDALRAALTAAASSPEPLPPQVEKAALAALGDVLAHPTNVDLPLLAAFVAAAPSYEGDWRRHDHHLVRTAAKAAVLYRTFTPSERESLWLAAVPFDVAGEYVNAGLDSPEDIAVAFREDLTPSKVARYRSAGVRDVAAMSWLVSHNAMPWEVERCVRLGIEATVDQIEVRRAELDANMWDRLASYDPTLITADLSFALRCARAEVPSVEFADMCTTR